MDRAFAALSVAVAVYVFFYPLMHADAANVYKLWGRTTEQKERETELLQQLWDEERSMANPEKTEWSSTECW